MLFPFSSPYFSSPLQLPFYRVYKISIFLDRFEVNEISICYINYYTALFTYLLKIFIKIITKIVAYVFCCL